MMCGDEKCCADVFRKRDYPRAQSFKWAVICLHCGKVTKWHPMKEIALAEWKGIGDA
jgi:hypothetical protein